MAGAGHRRLSRLDLGARERGRLPSARLLEPLPSNLFTDDDGFLRVEYHDGTGSPDVLAGADPPEHTAHRRLFFPELRQRKMAALEDDVRAATDELIDDMLGQSRPDVVSSMASLLPLRVVSEHVIGFRDVDVPAVREWIFAGSRFLGGRLQFADMGDVAEQAAGVIPWVTAQLDRALDREDSGDVLSAAAAAVRGGLLTHDEASFTLTVLLGAGGETTTALIGSAVCILADRADVQDALRAEPSRVPDFVEEVLRFESPFRFHPKSTERAVQLGGVTIPPNAMVATMWGSANRDEAVFDHPDEIVVGRPNAALHVGFGRGVHHCVGAALARLEARVAIEQLLARTSAFGLVEADPPEWVDSLWTRRRERVPLTLRT